MPKIVNIFIKDNGVLINGGKATQVAINVDQVIYIKESMFASSMGCSVFMPNVQIDLKIDYDKLISILNG